jgi:predicted kinase
MKKAFILIGPSGSGKSTVRRWLENNHPGKIAPFSLDDLRCKVFAESGERIPKGPAPLYAAAYDWCIANPKVLDEAVTGYWKECLHNADVIIVDNVNASKKSRAKWSTELKHHGFHVVMIHVLTPLETILERQKTRLDKSVPAAAVIAQYNKIEEPLVGTECDSYIVIDGRKKYEDAEWIKMISL